jgi:hypothetical protein
MRFIVKTYCKTTSRENEFRLVGTFEHIEHAIAAARYSIDRSLSDLFVPGISREALYTEFERFGEIPCIFRTGNERFNGIAFNPLQYAMARCGELCSDGIGGQEKTFASAFAVELAA